MPLLLPVQPSRPVSRRPIIPTLPGVVGGPMTGVWGMDLTLAAASSKQVSFLNSVYNNATSPKAVTFPTAQLNDIIVVEIGGNKSSSTNAVTDCTTTTTAGSTDPWTEVLENFNAAGNTSCWYSSARTRVSTTGSVTVSVARTQTGTANNYGFTAWLLRGYQAVGVSNGIVDSAAEVVSLAGITEGSAVLYSQFDWDVAVPTSYVPATGATEVIRGVQGAGMYSATVAYWENQAAGTRNYGTDGSASTSIAVMAIEVIPA